MQERKVKEERTPWDFYTGSLKPELHPIFQGNPELKFALFQKIYKVSTLTLPKYAKTS